MLYWKTTVVAGTLRNLVLLECSSCLFQVGFKDIRVKSVIKCFRPSSFASVHFLSFFFFFSVYRLLCFFLALFCAAVLQHLLLSDRCRSALLLKLFFGCNSACFAAIAPNRARPNLYDTVHLSLTWLAYVEVAVQVH